MGMSRFDSATYASYSARTASMRHTDYKATSIKKDFDPKMITVRESVKSELNPHPTPIIVGLDVTGSMGAVVEACRKGLGTLFEEIIKRNPVSDPHVLAMAIGDMECDRSPVQATQFEADPVTIGKQIEDLYLERGGGGNNYESYLGPLYFALMRTKCDAFNENRKGYLFTVGDEEPQTLLRATDISRWFGDQPKQDYTAADLIATVERNWNIFHIIVEEGSYASGRPDRVKQEWRNLLGQRVIQLSDHTKMAEVIISTIEVTEGRDKDAVAKSWSDGTDLVVAKAVSGLPASHTGSAATGPISL